MSRAIKTCRYCGSRFPHLKFAEGCEWSVNREDIAATCGDCGSVKWCLLKSGRIECARCGKQRDIPLTNSEGERRED